MMPMTRGERLAYSRGYNRANANAAKRTEAVIKIARSYRERLTTTELPRCDKCCRWTRGHERSMWGTCAGGFEWSIGEGGMWADTHVGESKRAVITHDNFGCVNWLPRNAAVPLTSANEWREKHTANSPAPLESEQK